MCSLKDGLEALGLEKYHDVFAEKGFSYVTELVSLSPQELDRLMSEIGMLKGHTYKMKKLVEDVKLGKEIKPIAPLSIPKPQVQPSKFDQSFIQTKIDLTVMRDCKDQTEKRPAPVASQEIITKTLEEFLNLNLDQYETALNQLKSLQGQLSSIINSNI